MSEAIALVGALLILLSINKLLDSVSRRQRKR
jgi:hypothetical protein